MGNGCGSGSLRDAERPPRMHSAIAGSLAVGGLSHRRCATTPLVYKGAQEGVGFGGTALVPEGQGW